MPKSNQESFKISKKRIGGLKRKETETVKIDDQKSN